MLGHHETVSLFPPMMPTLGSFYGKKGSSAARRGDVSADKIAPFCEGLIFPMILNSTFFGLD